MAKDYYWMSGLDGTWIPTSGYGYHLFEAVYQAAANYFAASGYDNISFVDSLSAGPDGWTFDVTDDNGIRYYKVISTFQDPVYISLGFLFKYVYNQTGITPSNYQVNITGNLSDTIANTTRVIE